MPDFWEFPTVSMGLSPLMAIYQARFNRYLEDRGMKPVTDAKVWAFLGDGETDEPESLGAITLASREKLDNLIFVVNCNLQRLDGPVRGNGQIIQELESAFRGAGWNVIKVLWGSEWDPILERDTEGLLVKRMGELVDGEYQKLVVSSGAYVREHFFGSDPRLLQLVEPMSDAAGGTRSAQGLRCVQSGGRAKGQADGHFGAHDQGLRTGRSGRGEERHASAEEAQRRRVARVSFAFWNSAER
jgi:pyruvate dehydrogenase E1 component